MDLILPVALVSKFHLIVSSINPLKPLIALKERRHTFPPHLIREIAISQNEFTKVATLPVADKSADIIAIVIKDDYRQFQQVLRLFLNL